MKSLSPTIDSEKCAVYAKCLALATDKLYDLLSTCRSCVVLPEINLVLIEIAERLEKVGE